MLMQIQCQTQNAKKTIYICFQSQPSSPRSERKKKERDFLHSARPTSVMQIADGFPVRLAAIFPGVDDDFNLDSLYFIPELLRLKRMGSIWDAKIHRTFQNRVRSRTRKHEKEIQELEERVREKGLIETNGMRKQWMLQKGNKKTSNSRRHKVKE